MYDGALCGMVTERLAGRGEFSQKSVERGAGGNFDGVERGVGLEKKMYSPEEDSQKEEYNAFTVEDYGGGRDDR